MTNFLFLTTDQHHPRALGSVDPRIRTPHLDALAADGVRFDRAYCANPTCTPTRASLITGRYPSQHGAWTLGTKLPESEQTVGELLGDAGYRTALLGKAHFQPLASSAEHPSLEAYPLLHDLDYWRSFDGPFYGFDHVELLRNHTSEAHVGQHYALWLEEHDPDWRRHFQAPAGTLPADARHRWELPEELHYNSWLAERSDAYLAERAADGDPFLLWVSFPDPHPPYLVPEPWASMYDPAVVEVPELVPGEHDANPPHFGLTQHPDPDFSPWRESGQWLQGMEESHVRDDDERRRLVATYHGMVSFTDAAIGKVLASLEAYGFADDTVVVFTADHGHFYGQHGLQAKGPFHYEDLIRVPMIVRDPRGRARGVVSDAIQSHVDVAPTMLDYAGLPAPATMTGVSQHDVWAGGAERVRTATICEFHHEPTTVNLRSYIDERYKLTVYQGREYGELYDLASDPRELRNLWDDPAHRDLKERLLLRYIWAELAKEPMWMPRLSRA